MSLLPDSASFHERVQDCFVTYRGHGVSFSAVDLDLVDAWAQLEVPFEVVARGIRKAAEAALWDAAKDDGTLFSLRGAKRHVESEIAKYQRASTGRHSASPNPTIETPLHEQRHKKLVAAVKQATKPDPPPWLERLAMPSDYGAADTQETLALLLLMRSLPFSQRLNLLRQARALSQKAASFSATARRASLQFHRVALTRHAYELPAFW